MYQFPRSSISVVAWITGLVICWLSVLSRTTAHQQQPSSSEVVAPSTAWCNTFHEICENFQEATCAKLGNSTIDEHCAATFTGDQCTSVNVRCSCTFTNASNFSGTMYHNGPALRRTIARTGQCNLDDKNITTTSASITTSTSTGAVPSPTASPVGTAAIGIPRSALLLSSILATLAMMTTALLLV